MKQYDVIIVGGATSGSFLAQRLCAAGHTALIIEAKSEEKVGSKYDIFHVGKADMERFDLPRPEKGEDYAFEFTGSTARSAFGRYEKFCGNATVVGMHMHEYTLRMNRWAKAAGAQIEYDASFVDFIYTDGKITGVIYEKDGERVEAGAKLVADCSGIPSVARRKLPDGYGVENFEITPLDMFYVTLRYVKYLVPQDFVKRTTSWSYYKTWEAPEADPEGAILGIGANISFETGEKIYESFEKAVKLPRHELKYIERGTTPYRRPPYSFVADGFLASGDAACLTKPGAGEGVTSSMVQLEIAAEVISRLLAEGKPLSTENLWPINKRYIDAQGADFASQLATLVGAVATSAKENDYFFKKDIIFSEKTYRALGEGKALAYSTGEIISMGLKMAGGVLAGKLRISTIKALLKAMGDGDRVTAHYKAFPESPDGFAAWCKQADELWATCGSMVEALEKTLKDM